MASPLRPEVKEAVESAFDGWYANESRIDWEDFIDRVETISGVDLGSNMLSDEIKAIKKYVAELRRQRQ